MPGRPRTDTWLPAELHQLRAKMRSAEKGAGGKRYKGSLPPIKRLLAAAQEYHEALQKLGKDKKWST